MHGSSKSLDSPKAAACLEPASVEIRIRAGSKSRYWRDVWEYRELLTTLAARDIAVRYKQTVLGIAWAVLQPLTAAILMTFVFGKLVGLDTGSRTSYAAMVLAGMLPWQLFSNILSACGQSLVSNANLISKVYFPRVIIPLAALSVALVDFAVMSLVFVPLLFWQGAVFGTHCLFLPAFLILACLAALGPALLITALNVKYRDFRFLVPFLLQMGLYISPVAYSSSLVREKLGSIAAHLYALNPLVGVIDGFRWALTGSQPPVLTELLVSCLVVWLFLFMGISYFRKTERQFADVI
jgi:lipopolysaccharide transport system permease protein